MRESTVAANGGRERLVERSHPTLDGDTHINAKSPISPHPKSLKGVRASVKSPKIVKKAVDGLSRFLQSRSKLVESPFPPRSQTWKQTFWTGTQKPNSYPKSTDADQSWCSSIVFSI
jgi:hypothetical protein